MRILRLALILIAFSFINTSLFAQTSAGGSTFQDAVPFCTNDPVFATPFDACFSGSTDSNCTTSGQAGPNYGCLGSQPFPTWYFLQIDQAGNLNFQITQNTAIDDDGTPTGTGLDVDYIIWGPFADTDVFDQLTAANIESCSFSSAPVEFPTITNAQEGDVYVFMVTNFSGQQAEIFIEQTNDPMNTGVGSTDCSIVNASLGADQDACEGTTVTLDATSTEAAGYAWAVDTGAGFMPVLDGGGAQVTTAMLNVTTSGEYQVTITDTAGDTGTDEVIVTFFTVPTATAPDDIFECDTDSDGFASFNLDAQILDILNGQSATEFSVSFHLSQADADTGAGALAGTTIYNSVSDEIFVRVENNGLPACSSTTSFNIEVVALPIATMPATYEICDDNIDGDDTNGVATFNLSTLDDEVLNGLDPVQFEVSYHVNGPEASSNTNPLPAAYTNTSSPNNDTIFARVENTAFTGCFSITSINLRVNALPVLTTPVTLRQCDDDTNGVTTLNLTQSQSELSTNSANETFTYVDASGTPITDPTAYINSGSPFSEAIAVTVTNLDGCSREGVINVIVSASQIPTGTLFADEIECDTDGDGIAVFDFSGATATIETFFSPQVVSVAYYETEQEALSEINPITDIAAYSNNPLFTSAGGVQDIWVRVEADTDNGCVGLGEHVRLTVTPNPTFLPNISSIETCSAVANAATFDLTQNVAEITGGDADLEVTFYESIAAYTATPAVAIASPTSFSNSSNPQTIFYSLRSTSSTCTTFDTAMNFEIIVNQNPVAITPSELQVCDDDGVVDGFTTVDLSQKDAEITSGFNANLTVTYHLDAAGATTGDASIPDSTMFTTTSNPQIVGVRVTDNTTGCFSTTSMSIRSFPVPVAVTPADYEACDDDNDGVFDFFVLSSRDTEITGGDPSLSVAYYLTQADADNAPVGQELDAAMYINNDPFEQIIFARVFNAIGCYDTNPSRCR
ncbi:hypothetical protein [Dokdonia sp. Asnod3-C12]|uniref:hypothetical protein n=1 Tax=Dokdonia sp. Asnod3-C12 TaxID=3160575 RepID=UPI00386ED4FE